MYKKEFDFCEAMYNFCKKLGVNFQGINIFAKRTKLINNFNLVSTNFFKVRNVNNTLFNMFSHTKFGRVIFRTNLIFKNAYDEIKLFQPDVVIFRYGIMGIPVFFNPKKINSNILFISEHQTKEIEEISLNNLGYIVSLFERITQKKYFKNVDAILGVTSEIAKYEVSKENKNIPYLVLTNGININRYPKKKFIEFKGDILKMIFVSAITSKYQGLDRLLIGMKNYNNSLKIELHVVGNVTKDLINNINLLNLDKKVIFHGTKYGKELDMLFDDMHLAIGSLGTHRKGLKYASTLKAREYMARGIPFVISHIDEDIDNNFPFVLKLSSDDNPVDIEELLYFTKYIYKKYGKEISVKMRNYAVRKMAYNSKIKKLVDFIYYLKNVNLHKI